VNHDHDLDRFVTAQAPHYDRVLAEIRAGRKRTHWMWFVFPQIAGLGHSAMAVHYAIRSLDEARAYLAHPVLGPRLIECFEAILTVRDRSARDILGSPDDLKLQSCATLFAHVTSRGSVFDEVLDRYFDGRPDRKTLSFVTPKQN
jgi:uncharacterized protein (DUF1810 family)